MNMESKS